ncbi:hypothetical protein QYF50_15530 [Paenibacillus vini]|uniref:hypothetical protein n=1 Tax=Paenibacillus vini TaxID=1476024 RepID=UPI0025B64148|nr:hypothetical protein [Paenibacillus vini]MDN4069263.1 hypothetical protein [Paenibacillus vini]MDN4069316.1 hypothetical protein [Paenibacillus vini]
MANKEKQTPDIAAGFTKEQFLGSRQWTGTDKDVLSVVLKEGKTYTLAEAKSLVDEFKNGEVKG